MYYIVYKTYCQILLLIIKFDKNIDKNANPSYSKNIKNFNILEEMEMKTSTKERPLQWILNQYDRGNISFNHKLQRPIGQWNPKMKSLLIHSLLTGIPVNTIYTVEENNIIYTIDGSQRTSTCIEYLQNKFALSKDTPNVSFAKKDGDNVINQEYEIAGKKFKKLDPDVQSALLATSLEFCTISEYTDDEVKEMFRRQNMGKPLNANLMRVVYESDSFSDKVYSLATHPFIEKIVTKAQKKNGVDRNIIIQSLMLIETDAEHNYTSFRKNDIDAFVLDHADTIDDSKFEVLKTALDKFNEAFEDVKIPVTSIPMILYSGYRIVKGKGSFSKLVALINEFITEYDANEEYKQYVLSGTGGSENVTGRLDYWKNLIKAI